MWAPPFEFGALAQDHSSMWALLRSNPKSEILSALKAPTSDTLPTRRMGDRATLASDPSAIGVTKQQGRAENVLPFFAALLEVQKAINAKMWG